MIIKKYYGASYPLSRRTKPLSAPAKRAMLMRRRVRIESWRKIQRARKAYENALLLCAKKLIALKEALGSHPQGQRLRFLA